MNLFENGNEIKVQFDKKQEFKKLLPSVITDDWRYQNFLNSGTSTNERFNYVIASVVLAFLDETYIERELEKLESYCIYVDDNDFINIEFKLEDSKGEI